eukprot:TRINITY_DN8370_c0_g1_i1.p1 TRINITY_DN8370_c0_g1~~TRINITY_DN8370_c0_g1_i1.p1  ORF type:complete len:613 (-),score=197.42 TRINITY_DN8370_c0_g1_i1:44-1882(-)
MPTLTVADISMAKADDIHTYFAGGDKKYLHNQVPKTFREKLEAFFHRTPITPHATVALTWWEKWKYYGRFPWKPLIHLLIAILATSLVAIEISLSQNAKSVFVQTSSTMQTLFIGDGGYKVDGVYTKDFIYQREVIDHLNRSIQNYYSFPSDSVDFFKLNAYHKEKSAEIPNPPFLTVYSYKDPLPHYTKRISEDTITTVYPLNLSYVGPFQNANISSKFFHNLVTMKVNFTYFTLDVINSNSYEQEWNVEMVYDFSDRASRISAYLNFQDSDYALRIQLYSSFKYEIGIEIVLIGLCILSHFLCFISLKDSFVILQKAKMRYMSSRNKKFIKWEDVPFHIKIHLFNFWFVFSFVADTLLPIGCLFNIFRYIGAEPTKFGSTVSITLGVGSMFAWFNLTRYVGVHRKFTILINAIGDGLPRVARVIISVAPIFFGYVLSGVYFFSYHIDGFSNFSETFASLFSLQNGDNIRSTFADFKVYGVFGLIYLFTFLFFGIYVFANIFISIISDSYQMAKKLLSHNAEGDIAADEHLWKTIFANDDDSQNNNNNNNQAGENSPLLVNEPSTPLRNSVGERMSSILQSSTDEVHSEIRRVVEEQKRLQHRLDELVRSL